MTEGIPDERCIFISPFSTPLLPVLPEPESGRINVLGVGDEPYDNLSQDVRTALNEYYQVDDMHNYDALVRACGYFTHRIFPDGG